MDRASGSGVFARDPDALLDVLELAISGSLRESQEHAAVCKVIAAALDTHAPGWRSVASDDAEKSESQMLTLSSEILGEVHRQHVLPQVVEARRLCRQRTAWRIEGTFREFPRSEPLHCWFDYPIHRTDPDRVLQDLYAVGEEPPWKRGKQAAAEAAAREASKRMLALQEAFNDCMDKAKGSASLKTVAERLGKSDKTVRNWVTAQPGDWVIDNGQLQKATIPVEF